MPRGDKTGPEGKGPLTGRGMGTCGQGCRLPSQSVQRGMGLGPCGNGIPRGMRNNKRRIKAL